MLANAEDGTSEGQEHAERRNDAWMNLASRRQDKTEDREDRPDDERRDAEQQGNFLLDC